MTRIDNAIKVCEIIERHFERYAEDTENMNGFNSLEEFAKDFLNWTEGRREQEEMISEVAPLVSEIIKRLFK